MSTLVLATFLFVCVPLVILIGFWAGRRGAIRVSLHSWEQLGPDFFFDRAPDYVGVEFTCEHCGHYAGATFGTVGCALRGRCECGTVYELIPSNS